MEVIKKTISLEPFYSRQKSTIPFVGMDPEEFYPSLNWGKIAYGVDFNRLLGVCGDTAANAFGPGIWGLGTMNYQDMMKMYHLVKKGEIGDVDGEELEKLKSIVAFIDSKRVIGPPPPPRDPCCNPCAVPSPVNEYEMDNGDYYVPPSVNISICLVQSTNIVGAYTFANKDWVEGKRYFAGDKVIYDGKTYVLKPFEETKKIKSSNGSMTAGFYTGSSVSAFIEYDEAYEGLSELIFKEFIASSEEEIVDMGYIYAKISNGDGWIYYVRPSWGGFNNVYDGRIYFDELYNDKDPDAGFCMRGQNNTVHWNLAEDIFSHGAYSITSGGDGNIKIAKSQDRDIGFGKITIPGAVWESKLVNFKRNTKTITYDGFELPGKLIPSTATLDLPYIVGTIKNIDTSGERAFGDILTKIEIESDSGEILDTLDIASDHTVLTLDADDIGKTGYITFTYYIGADLKEEDLSGDSIYVFDNNGDKGVLYRDRYRFTVKNGDEFLDIDGKKTETSFRYIDIDYSSAEVEAVLENVNNFSTDVRMSDIEITKKSMTEGGNPEHQDFQNADYFMEDYQLGISFVANNNENVYIDRGSATAFERHMRLSEVDTLQDLGLIGNGLFKIKS